jgi:hypothetical protein
MSFFNSEIVRDEIREMGELQEEIMSMIPSIPISPREKKLEFTDKMLYLIERQKIFYGRISLSDDPEALEIKQRFKDAAILLGMAPNSMNMFQVYDDFAESIREMRKKVLDGLA